jgi:hypothetical protein
MNIVVVSMACCNPALKPQDQLYLAKIREALAKTEVEAQVELVKATEMMASLGDDQLSALKPLIAKYGSAVAPAMFIDGELALYGGVPTLEKLISVISKIAGGS